MTNKTEKVYHLDVETLGDDGLAIANAYGDLDIIAYVAKKAEKLIGSSNAQEASLTLVEVERIGGANVRTIATLTADAETVAMVLKGRIANERKANRPGADTSVQGEVQEPAPTVDTQHTDGVPQGHTEF